MLIYNKLKITTNYQAPLGWLTNRFESCSESEHLLLSVLGQDQTYDVCQFWSNSTMCFGHLHSVMLTSEIIKY